ncbi:hypothetical protein DFJ73DRAFT_806577 [Zopfochytrium polystomum]|nr:hypothetical protein DFJ73DRAFT_806577 [Zopfochytrium polystomum]
MFANRQQDTAVGLARSFRNRRLIAYPVEELRYLLLLNEILNKPRWVQKRKDTAIWGKWKEQSETAFPSVTVSRDAPAGTIVEPAVDWDLIQQELDFIEASLLLHVPQIEGATESAIVTPTAVHGVHLSDNLFSERFLARLNELADPLERSARAAGSWHPGSKGKVLNLVHPSPHSVVYGRTYSSATPNALVGEKLVWRRRGGLSGDISANFQWLPSDVVVDADGRVRIDSYINNLNPANHAPLYDALALCIEGMLPMFERALGSLKTEPFHRMNVNTAELTPQEATWSWIRRLYAAKVGKTADELEEEEAGPNRDELYNALDSFRDDLRFEDWVSRMRYTPTIRDFTRWTAAKHEDVTEHELLIAEYLKDRWMASTPNIRENTRPEIMRALEVGGIETAHITRPLKNCRLKVIFKMANVHLTPENPDFEGGAWHIEGMENECIAASGLLYYEMENITESRLSFRNVFDSDSWHYRQGEHQHLQHLFGISNWKSEPLQSTGSAVARKGRGVVFPNFLHHKLEPFTLADRTKEGWRKVIAFFLVHPDAPEGDVLSTRTVPPQQWSWIKDTLQEALRPRCLPELVVTMIVDFLGTALMKDMEAKVMMEQISEERRNTKEGEFASIYKIALCEH